jgi:hypothetical protein
MQKQREQQLNFLRQQGLVKDESNASTGTSALRGNDTGGATTSDTNSIGSSSVSQSRSFLSSFVISPPAKTTSTSSIQ